MSSPPFTLHPATLADGPLLVRVQHHGFASDPFRLASFPLTPLSTSIADSITRWPANFAAPDAVYMKSLHAESGEMVGYSKWEMGREIAEEIMGERGEEIERRDPVGLNDELAEKMSGDIVAVREGVLGDRPRIVLSLLCTLPAFRGKGVATQHLQWATELADRVKLPIWLDASPMSVKLYEKFGFKAVGEVKSDLSLGSKGVGSGVYVHTCMLREPRKGDA